MSEFYVVYRSDKSDREIMRVIGGGIKELSRLLVRLGYQCRFKLSLKSLIKLQEMESSEYNNKYGGYGKLEQSFIKNIHFDKHYKTFHVDEIPSRNKPLKPIEFM